jgi:uncharacterized repeat protein (TIGR03803 family)
MISKTNFNAANASLFLRANFKKMCTGGVALILCACGGSDYSGIPAYNFTLSGNISGLQGSAITLLLNGAGSQSFNANGAFTFSTTVTSGANYVVSVGSQPAGQTCSLTNASGSSVKSNVTNVTVTCAVNGFMVGGTVSGLAPDEQVSLLINGGNKTVVTANTTFTFSGLVAMSSSYAVTIGVDPLAQTCTLTHASAPQITANVTNVGVNCATSTLATLYSFKSNSTDVGYPVGNIVQGADGYFYGTGYEYGSGGGGGVFRISATGTAETLLYSFAGGGSDGDYPYSGLMQTSNGNIYGLTSSGDSHNEGTIYQITPAGAETVLHAFGAAADAAYPEYGTLVQGTDGYLYGTTYEGGANGEGAAFRIKPDGTSYSVVYSFGATQADGYNPYGGLVFGADGNLYGVTAYGGANNEGLAFKLTTSGTFTALHSFGGSGDGQIPLAALILGHDGNFYGTTSVGGANGRGVVFKMTPSGTESVLYTFGTNANDGSGTYEPLIEGTDGNLYGICYQGGISNKGIFFVVSPSTGQEVVLHRFTGGATDGELPVGLVLGSDGHFYGDTLEGGTANAGVFFRY